MHLAEARILHLQSEHKRNQHKEYSVAGVSHTHREEEHKERTEYRGRVELVVGRHTIHSCEHLEVLCKPVVLQLNRRIVLFGCRLVAVVDVHRVEAGAEPLIVRCRSKAGENGEVVINCLFCGRLCEIEVETGKGVVVCLADFVTATFEVCKQLLLLLEFALQEGEFFFLLIHRTFRSRDSLKWEAVLFLCRRNSHEKHLRLSLADDFQWLDFSPGRVEFLFHTAVES